MVIDSLFQKRSQNLPIYLQADVPPPPPELEKLKLVRAACDGEWDCTIACCLCMGKMNLKHEYYTFLSISV